MNQLTQFKVNYIEYLLFNYHFKSRISVWVLNYIKATPELLSQVHFVDEMIPSHPTLELSMEGAAAQGIRFSNDYSTLINTNEIFYEITSELESFDIKLHFPQDAVRDLRLDELLLQQLLHSPYYRSYTQDIQRLNLTTQREQLIIDYLKDNIDLSLQLNERELFFQFSHLLNQFSLRSLNSSSGD